VLTVAAVKLCTPGIRTTTPLLIVQMGLPPVDTVAMKYAFRFEVPEN
jgi:hypothetical protein